MPGHLSSLKQKAGGQPDLHAVGYAGLGAHQEHEGLGGNGVLLASAGEPRAGLAPKVQMAQWSCWPSF